MKGFFVAAVAATCVSANSTPIYSKYPGWLEGSGKLNINIELFEDYLCSDCKAFNPIFEALLDTDWLGAKVSD